MTRLDQRNIHCRHGIGDFHPQLIDDFVEIDEGMGLELMLWFLEESKETCCRDQRSHHLQSLREKTTVSDRNWSCVEGEISAWEMMKRGQKRKSRASTLTYAIL
jgi:hypothetical protein